LRITSPAWRATRIWKVMSRLKTRRERGKNQRERD
jgi:hypothetical protein